MEGEAGAETEIDTDMEGGAGAETEIDTDMEGEAGADADKDKEKQCKRAMKVRCTANEQMNGKHNYGYIIIK